jgi:hypothetical protein
MSPPQIGRVSSNSGFLLSPRLHLTLVLVRRTFRGTNVWPHPGQARSRGRFQPQCVSSVAAQFAQTIRRFSNAATSPVLVLAAQLATRLEQAAIEQASFEVEPVIGRVLNEHFVEWDVQLASRPPTTDVRVEMVGPDDPSLSPLLERPVVRAFDLIAEVSERISPHVEFEIAARASASENGGFGGTGNTCSQGPRTETPSFAGALSGIRKAGEHGFEPRPRAPKARVLPLHHSPESRSERLG